MENIISLEGQDAAHDNGIVQAAAELRITLENFRHARSAMLAGARVLGKQLRRTPTNLEVQAMFTILSGFEETRELASKVLGGRNIVQVDRKIAVKKQKSPRKKKEVEKPKIEEVKREQEELVTEIAPEVIEPPEYSEAPQVDHLIQV